MKLICIKNKAGKVLRVPVAVAEAKVAHGWTYCPKSEWRSQRD